MHLLKLLSIPLLSGPLFSCASIESDDTPYTYASPQPVQTASKIVNPAEPGYTQAHFPAYTGPKKRLQVIPFGISAHTLKKYPALADKKIGFGLSSRVLDILYDSNRFEFIDNKEDILKSIIDHWGLAQGGAANPSTNIKPGQLHLPEYFIYAEVFDFGTDNSEQIRGTHVSQTKTTIVGIQLRLISANTRAVIPASGLGRHATTYQGSIFKQSAHDFEHSAIGASSNAAIIQATHTLLRRMP